MTDAASHRAARAIAAISLLAGLVVLFGWATGTTALTTFSSGISMKANTAACFVLLGAGLGLAPGGNAARRRLAAGLGVLVALVGALTLSQHLTGADLGIDQLLFTEPAGMPGTAAPGRMGPPASSCFLLLGLALALLQGARERARRAAQVLAFASGFVALLPLVGYAYRTPSLYGIARYTGIALVTAALLEALAAGVLLARPEAGFLRVLRGSGGAARLARRTLVYALGLPLLVGWAVDRGYDLRFYDGAFAICLLVLSLILAGVLLTWRDAVRLAAVEDAREAAREALQQALEREQRARAVAEEASRAKDAFLATVSHELRTPLNAILGWARLLDGAEEAARRRRAGEVIDRSARSLAKLVDDLLSASALSAGRFALAPRRVDLEGVCAGVVDAFHPAAARKGVRLELAAQAGSPPVLGDPERLAQVFTNLLANAVKFTPAGGSVVVRVEREGGSARVAVSDTGIGIPPELQPHVFDRFTQASRKDYGGLGLGLSVARDIVEQHGGTIAVASAGVGRGTTLTVTLALADAAGEAAPPPRRAVGLTGIAVLVVDDDPDAVEVVCEFLGSRGVRARGAASAREAREALAAGTFDALVCDVGMPVEDGLQFVSWLRRAEAERGLPRLPAVALTAYTSADDRDRALRAGFDAHLGKPMDAERLAEALQALASARPRGRSEASA